MPTKYSESLRKSEFDPLPLLQLVREDRRMGKMGSSDHLGIHTSRIKLVGGRHYMLQLVGAQLNNPEQCNGFVLGWGSGVCCQLRGSMMVRGFSQ